MFIYRPCVQGHALDVKRPSGAERGVRIQEQITAGDGNRMRNAVAQLWFAKGQV